MAFAAPRYSPSPYRPSGGFSPMGVLVMLVLAVAAGVAVGVVGGIVKNWLYLVLLFPMAFGMAVGGATMLAVKRGKVRSPMLASAVALIGGLTVIPVVHAVGYYQFRQELGHVDESTRAIARVVSPDAIPDELAQQGVTANAIRMLRVSSFPEYVDAMAHEGVSISRHSSSGMNLGYVGSYIYWGVEVGLVVLLAITLARRAAAAPFCDPCESWMSDRLLGGLAPPPEDAARAVAGGDLDQLRAQQPSRDASVLGLWLSTCARCGVSSTGNLRLTQTRTTSKGKTTHKTLAHATYPGHAIPAIEGLFQAPRDS